MQRFLYIYLFVLVLILSACGVVTTSSTAHKTHHSMSPTAVPTATPARVVTPAIDFPSRLLIPAIGVNAPVERVGIANNDMATPPQSPWTDVGWYSIGTRPGEMGSAVIDGHLDRPGGYPAVFWNLRNLQAGSIVMVKETSGKLLHFRITRIASYPPAAAPLQEIFGNTAGTYLNLITCAGDWIPSEHQTTLRLVVYTTLVQ